MSLSRVGLTGVERVVRIGVDGRSAQLFAARIECFAEPRSGVAAGRFEAVIRDALRELGDAGVRAERLAQRLAERVRTEQDAERATVTITARFPERRPAPVSGVPTQEISTLHAAAAASGHGTRRSVGVSAQGITTSPHAQDVLRARARARLTAGGFSEPRIARILEALPVATHDQRGFGTLHLTCPEDCAVELDAAALLAIVETAMSSEIYELMKRSDEAAVIDKSHRRPRSAEDCVHAMLAGVVEQFPDLPGKVLVYAAQENVETLRAHHLVVERAARLGDLR